MVLDESTYTPSKPVLLGIFCIAFILTRTENLSSIGYLLGFTLFSLLLVLDYVTQWEKERVEHAKDCHA